MNNPGTHGWGYWLQQAIALAGTAYRRRQPAAWLIVAFSLPLLAFPFCHPAAGSERWERVVSLNVSGAVRSIVTGHGAERTIVYAVVEDWGVFRSEDGGGTWRPANYLPRDGLGRIHVSALALSPSDPRVALAAIADHPIDDWPSVYKTTDGGRSWVARRGLPVTDLEAIAIGAGGRAYASCGSRIFRSSDEGDTWLETGQRPTAGPVLAMAVDEASGALYMGTEGDGLWVSADHGSTWEPVLPGRTVYAIAITQGRGLYAGTDDGVYCSTGAGASWEPLAPAGLSGKANLLASHSPSSRLLLSLEAEPVLASTDGGAHWWRPSRLPTGVRVTALAPDPTRTERIYVGTNWGLWRCTLPDSTGQSYPMGPEDS